jgi:DNA-binding transcriptional regulator YiaG
MEKIAMRGFELQEIRKKHLRLKQDEFGAVVGAHRTTVSDWERTDAEVPHCAALLARLMAADPVLREKILKMAGV